jgi:hypothetical protein
MRCRYALAGLARLARMKVSPCGFETMGSPFSLCASSEYAATRPSRTRAPERAKTLSGGALSLYAVPKNRSATCGRARTLSGLAAQIENLRSNYPRHPHKSRLSESLVAAEPRFVIRVLLGWKIDDRLRRRKLVLSRAAGARRRGGPSLVGSDGIDTVVCAHDLEILEDVGKSFAGKLRFTIADVEVQVRTG